MGHIALFCGDDKSGYVHIRKEHQDDWQSLMDQMDALTGVHSNLSNWDDFMLYMTDESLTPPGAGYPLDIGNNKLCYSTKIELYEYFGDQPPKVVKVVNPTIIVSANNKKVITSIPTTGAVASNCYSAN